MKTFPTLAFNYQANLAFGKMKSQQIFHSYFTFGQSLLQQLLSFSDETFFDQPLASQPFVCNPRLKQEIFMIIDDSELNQILFPSLTLVHGIAKTQLNVSSYLIFLTVHFNLLDTLIFDEDSNKPKNYSLSAAQKKLCFI